MIIVKGQTIRTQSKHPIIGTLTESSLHVSIKALYSLPGDRSEEPVENFIIDIIRADRLIEIQIGNFSSLRPKLERLLNNHIIQILHPIPVIKWIIRQGDQGAIISKRKSHKRGKAIDIFNELIYIPQFLSHPNLVFELLLTEQTEILRNDGKGSWRRKGWSIADRGLLSILNTELIENIDDMVAFIPQEMRTPFTNKDLARALNCKYSLAQKMTYVLRKTGRLMITGKSGNSNLYDYSPEDSNNQNHS
ncbi:MAG: hypothetical protein MUO76_03550 [Anaerolineaceae bacterium]|nr:hypothetical protein [Anaerolineaceae bacterium]